MFTLSGRKAEENHKDPLLSFILNGDHQNGYNVLLNTRCKLNATVKGVQYLKENDYIFNLRLIFVETCVFVETRLKQK